MSKVIYTKKGEEILVDDDWYEMLSLVPWCTTNAGYAIRRGGELMQRIILDTPKGMCTNYINGNKLDNRRCNLRVCTRQENVRTKRSCKHTTSIYKGVHLISNETNPWRARVYDEVSGKYKHLGVYPTEEDAAIAYDKYAKSNFGDYVKLNIIGVTA